MPAATTSDPLAWPISEIILPVLATWRLTHMLWVEDGPWDVAAKLRNWARQRGLRAFDCLYCLSLWVALPIALMVGRSASGMLLGWLAFSGGAILLENLLPGTAPPAIWQEDSAPPAPQDEP